MTTKTTRWKNSRVCHLRVRKVPARCHVRETTSAHALARLHRRSPARQNPAASSVWEIARGGWIGKKLRGLKDLPEAQGDFFARVPGSEKQAVQPSTIAYVARLLIHRYEMLGVLDAAGYPTAGAMLWTDAPAPGAGPAVTGRTCPECGHPTLIRRDGCDFCTSCGYTGACG